MNSPFGLRRLVVADQRVGHAQDALRAAVVLLQPDDLHVGIVVLELENVAQVRAAPAVDRLVGIAGDGQVRVVDRQGPHDRVLGQVRVLILVDQDVAIALVERGADLGVLAQQRGDVQQQVVEIDGARRPAAAPDRPDRPAATMLPSGLPGRGSYCSAVIRLFLAQLMAGGDPLGRVERGVDVRARRACAAAPAGCRPCRRS